MKYYTFHLSSGALIEVKAEGLVIDVDEKNVPVAFNFIGTDPRSEQLIGYEQGAIIAVSERPA